jgi:hypothetical protein
MYAPIATNLFYRLLQLHALSLCIKTASVDIIISKDWAGFSSREKTQLSLEVLWWNKNPAVSMQQCNQGLGCHFFKKRLTSAVLEVLCRKNNPAHPRG